MGRSSGCCLRIISCGNSSSESVDRDALNASSENKGSNKRGWSFRKRSPRYQVRTNEWMDELSRAPKPNIKARRLSKMVIDSDKDEVKFDSSLDESSVIVIQSAVRKYLAERELIRYKKIVELQAGVRGHLVRCRAAGALRCIQSIVKMQALVRARKKVKQDSETIQHSTYISIDKLLSNRFAIQLLESTPRTKQISIKCDPSKDDSSWKWLERWTSVSSPQLTSKQEHDKVIDTKNQIGNIVFEQTSDVLDESKQSNAGPAVGPEKPVVGPEQPKRPSIQPVGPPVYESLKLGHSRNGGSECGTELSVTSMLDSPDPSEIENIECNKESKVLDKEDHASLGTELTHSISNLSENFDCNTSTDHIELEPETGRQMYKSLMHTEVESPETSPKGHVTASEHQVTPSSQISNNKRTKKTPTQKPKPWSNHGSGLRSSLDYLPKETNPVNRRDSFGSQSSEPVDQEPRDSCSSNSIPSYMQITASAKAKALANNSPRSSPDGQVKEAYLKKRHSLPGSVSGRSGSPRVKQVPQQTIKGNNKPERKWQK